MTCENRILVVDDAPENIQILVNTLKNHYTISVATSGQKALDILDNGISIDLILLDIMMPEMDGFEVCKRIKSNNKTKDIPIIFISILDDTESILKGFELGGVDYVAKPFEVKEVITRVRTHIELSKKHKELEKKLEDERKQRQEEERLIFQREKLAEMGEMIAMISHQMKQPLTTISMGAANLKADQLIGDGIDGDELIEIMDQTMESVKFLDGTINDFRDFLRPDSTAVRISLKETIDKSLRIIRGSLSKREIEFEVKECDGTCYVEAYPNELIQVILNLLKNAMDVLVSEKVKDPKITISCRELEDFQYIEVEDNGGGIPDDKKELIFKSGYTTKSSTQGSGLGLYICKLIMEQHCNGKIGIKDGKAGALFYLEFPRIKD